MPDPALAKGNIFNIQINCFPNVLRERIASNSSMLMTTEKNRPITIIFKHYPCSVNNRAETLHCSEEGQEDRGVFSVMLPCRTIPYLANTSHQWPKSIRLKMSRWAHCFNSGSVVVTAQAHTSAGPPHNPDQQSPYHSSLFPIKMSAKSQESHGAESRLASTTAGPAALGSMRDQKHW